jgi:hypothetical protein
MKPLIYVLSLTTITLAGCTSEKLDNCSSENLDITGRWTVVGLVQDGKPWGVSSGFFLGIPGRLARQIWAYLCDLRRYLHD